MGCTSLGSLLRPLFYFLCSNLKANLVLCLCCLRCFAKSSVILAHIVTKATKRNAIHTTFGLLNLFNMMSEILKQCQYQCQMASFMCLYSFKQISAFVTSVTNDLFTTVDVPSHDLAHTTASSWNKFVYRIYSGSGVTDTSCTAMCAFDHDREVQRNLTREI